MKLFHHGKAELSTHDIRLLKSYTHPVGNMIHLIKGTEGDVLFVEGENTPKLAYRHQTLAGVFQLHKEAE